MARSKGKEKARWDRMGKVRKKQGFFSGFLNYYITLKPFLCPGKGSVINDYEVFIPVNYLSCL
jgi:hypothetical protein